MKKRGRGRRRAAQHCGEAALHLQPPRSGHPLSGDSLCVALLILPDSPTGFILGQNLFENRKRFLDSKQLTARRLWFISAPSIFVCLSESLASAALSLPAKSMKEILEKRHSRNDFFGILVYFYISDIMWPQEEKEHGLSSGNKRHYC